MDQSKPLLDLIMFEFNWQWGCGLSAQSCENTHSDVTKLWQISFRSVQAISCKVSTDKVVFRNLSNTAEWFRGICFTRLAELKQLFLIFEGSFEGVLFQAVLDLFSCTLHGCWISVKMLRSMNQLRSAWITVSYGRTVITVWADYHV